MALSVEAILDFSIILKNVLIKLVLFEYLSYTFYHYWRNKFDRNLKVMQELVYNTQELIIKPPNFVHYVTSTSTVLEMRF